jgi:hypothetical protein
VRWFLRAATATATAPFLWCLSFATWSAAEVKVAPANRDGNFEIFDLRFPSGAVRIMFYVLVGIIIVLAVSLLGLVFYRGRPND